VRNVPLSDAKLSDAKPTADGSAAAVLRSFDARYGDGVDRGLVLGGGGLFFVAWQVAYLQTLALRGLRFEGSDRIVGTSAGSMVASALAGGKLGRFHAEVKMLARAPALVSTLAPSSKLAPSQERALGLFLAATDAEPATIKEIGHSALAAATPRPETTRRNTALIVGWGRLPSDRLHITCVDTYTTERCVLRRSTEASAARAVAASSAVPGIFAPQPIGDRRCMDGGVSGTGLHLDLVAGARRVLVLTLTEGAEDAEGMMTSSADGPTRELESLQKSGTDVVMRAPEKVDLTDLMSPAAVPGALAMGARQAADDTELLRKLWN
jgi:NTE family protein